MRYDDRLLTVLSQPVGDRHDAAVRWRQLVDLVARAGPESSSEVVAQALQTIRSDAAGISEELRAAAARAVAARPLPIGLLEYFVSDRLSVSAPVLAAATLDAVQWRALLEHADEETRQFIEALHPEATAPVTTTPQRPRDQQAEPSPRPPTEPQPAASPSAAGPSLSEVVARIERRRRSRETQRTGPRTSTPEEAPSLFRWECGPGGDIAWVDGGPRGALIGRSIARVQEDDADRIDEEVVRAFAMRAPFRDADLTIAGEGILAGAWKISGLPAFEPTDGRFAGYRGIALRDTPAPVRREATHDILSDPDSLRELVHEIKTPLNAIIGFAEIIAGQYLGPADHRYRDRAGEIVAQSRLLLSAIDDLDFAARIHSSSATSRQVDLAQLLESAGESLRTTASARGVELAIGGYSGTCLAALEREIAERLIVRFATALIERAEAGEHLRMSVEQSDAQCRVPISRPAALRNASDALLFDGVRGESEKQADLAAGFSLRLVRGLARLAGGDLVASPASLALVFPRA